jgi:spermidine/putrescine transport system substrate-binding protein
MMKKNGGPNRPGLGWLPVFLTGLVLLAAAGFLGSCSKKTDATGDKLEDRLYVYNWTYYTPPSIIEKFEKEYGVTVYYDEYSSIEDMYAKIQSGGSGYDIIFPSADYVSIMIAQDMLEKIDKSKLSNLGNIDPVILQKASYDPGMDYSIPYYWGASGIIVNTAHVPDFEKSWTIFGRKDLKGRMVMLDDMREVLGDALATLGYSINTKSRVEINLAADMVVNEWKPNLVKFDAEAFGKGYANGDFWVVQGYIETVMEEVGDNEELRNNTAFFIPREGGPAYLDSMCILKGAKNINLAHKFLDFIHRPEIYAEFVNFFGLPATVNIPARALVEGTPIYTPEDLAPTEIKDDVGEALDLYNNVWFDRVRIGE